MDLEVQHAVAPAHEHGLIHEPHVRAPRDAAEELLDVLGIEPDAAVARAHPDAVRLVRAVDQVSRQRQRERESPERIVGPGRHDARQPLAPLGVLLANRRGHVPDGVADLLRDLRLGDRRRPTLRADADRMRRHARRGRVRRRGAGLLGREVVEAHRGHVDQDAFARRVGQDRLRRQEHRRRLARQPLIDAGVRRAQLVEPQVERAADRGERVFVAREEHLRLADQLLTGRERDIASVERREPRGLRVRRARCRRRCRGRAFVEGHRDATAEQREAEAERAERGRRSDASGSSRRHRASIQKRLWSSRSVRGGERRSDDRDRAREGPRRILSSFFILLNRTAAA